MKKITTLFKKDPYNLNKIINEIQPENMWVYDYGIPTRKYDGEAHTIIQGKLYKRYDAKHGKKAPEGSIPCQNPDAVTGHYPHWRPTNETDKWSNLAFQQLNPVIDGTYELIGEKVQNNPEHIKGNCLVPHGKEILPLFNFSYESIRDFLSTNDIEGIVFHDKSGEGRMCKIRKSDFGFTRNSSKK